jgi:UDP-N-acetylglucosamine 4,6-dehydratase/5-epimerase
MLNNQTILITGGTGSFGKNFVNHILKNYSKIKKIIVFSRDELKQHEMRETLKNHKNFSKLRFFIGDIRDLSRLMIAFKNVDIVVHAAALKQVDTAEYNPTEFIKTNIIGSQNIIEACFYNNIKKVIALSTDKASSPINLYGATKLCSDKLFISANFFLGEKKFSVVRYGNVEGSRGSIIPVFLSKKSKDTLSITHKDMTRFSLSLEQSVELVCWAIKNSIGGEIFVPKIPSYKIMDLAKAINPKAKHNFIGLRPGEKIHEEMISSHDSFNTIELEDKYIICPNLTEKPHSVNKNKIINYYTKKYSAKKVSKAFFYQSGNNKHFLSIKELKKIISKFKINNFQ